MGRGFSQVRSQNKEKRKQDLNTSDKQLVIVLKMYSKCCSLDARVLFFELKQIRRIRQYYELEVATVAERS